MQQTPIIVRNLHRTGLCCVDNILHRDNLAINYMFQHFVSGTRCNPADYLTICI